MENRLDAIEQNISDLQSAITKLQSAYDSGKIITSVTPIDEENGGWKITFSDNSYICLTDGDNGNDGVTPFLLIDQDGYWCVSYDNGETFARVENSNGEYIKAQGPTGGQGEQGAEGVSIRVVINDEGYYVYEMYYLSNPTVVIDTITTHYTSDASKLISSIQQDDKTNIITIFLADGSSFVFNKSYNVPTSIAILRTDNVVLNTDSVDVVEFRVNPSNAIFNYDVTSEECQIAIDIVGKTRSSSYITTPTNYKLMKVEQCFDENGIMKQGQYKAHIKDCGVSNNYKEQVAIVLTIPNANNQTIQLSSSAFNVICAGNTLSYFAFLEKDNISVAKDIELPINEHSLELLTPYIANRENLIATFTTNGEKVIVNGIEQISGVTKNDFTSPVTYSIVSADGKVENYVVNLTTTGLPIVVINTPDEATIPPKTADWLPDTEFKIINNDGSIDYESLINIRGRGNSTWTYPKKPYAIKLEKKASILGMPKHKRWVLLANWMDRTMLRNRVAFRISEMTDLAWTPRGEFVEVILNGEHKGCYYLCEQIKIDENRVNIAELEDTDNEGDTVTGGYLMELDKYYDELFKFKSSIMQLPYMFKDPDEITDMQYQYMQNFINTLEEALYDDERFANREYAKYLDIDSFIDWWFVYELTGNYEPNAPKSVYMYKDRLRPLMAGPVWDFDWGTFMTWKTKYYSVNKAIYFERLFQDPTFKTRIKERWNLLKPNFETVGAYIDEEASKLIISDSINSPMWPITQNINGDETMSFLESVSLMKDNYNAKLNWLDKQIQQY